ncbi:MAG: hypothetical protein A2Z91_05970 [Deltaproteobacteria bacterium GWA2_38_16]|nr:MAG: hypothetical protein A2Z91_05970 [Deltaproteobacteria bacterium GWA2_38_16]OGQ03766.1 MAG: hypothetical protein A3D19_02840 [Deltaproteobacteria bacterium RIFCSPHIGHO2_02_FULL_38_15]OGQ33288.1 MAG: hypothetical protein A3A72_02215 [Deltaproteobacteria bacterium RIFCSPLOWO2_01_FULL_38_9]OGQ60698.1 MAG: hypothetical protein A3G92_02325 [Deltaproteobacteria bacterium RIFCSPLOWO2_12_FULL_38_8]HBQ21328.1 multidrug ABC transporter permease [Deltaproteobacteria bacterium]
MTFLLPLYTLWLREIVRFIRQKNRVFGALGQPLIFWLLFGTSFSASFKMGNMGYLEYFFPGVLTMIVLFTAIFSSFSIIEDRKEGFLQAVLVSPTPRLSLVLGKILGGATIATLQALLFLLLAPLLHIPLTFWTFVWSLKCLFLIALSLTAFGFCLAWRMDSIQGFHAMMMLVLLPLWFLSGAFFPSSGLPWILKGVMAINPLTYGLAAVRHLLYLGNPGVSDMPSLGLSLIVIVLWGAIATGVSLVVVKKH